jgi:hypothetical protein
MMTDPAAPRPGTHLDPDLMADLFEGLLDAAAADGARAHLASCPLCSADFALITGEADLGELLLPPVPIPQDVVARVEAALYREPPLAGAGAPAPVGSPVGHAAVAAQPRRRRFRIALGSLAGAALVVAGGIGVVTALNNGTTSSSASSNAAGGAAHPDTNGSHAAGQAPGAEPNTAGGSPGFGDMSIAQQAEALLSLHPVTPANGTAQAARPDCPPAAVPAGTKLLASTQTVYEGKQAWLLLYPRSGSATAVDVYVVDLDACTSGNPGQSVDHVVITRP